MVGSRMNSHGKPKSVMVGGRICPVILTCARNIHYFDQFVESFYKEAAPHLPPPVVIVDISAGPVLPGNYVQHLGGLWPRCVTIHEHQLNMNFGRSEER